MGEEEFWNKGTEKGPLKYQEVKINIELTYPRFFQYFENNDMLIVKPAFILQNFQT